MESASLPISFFHCALWKFVKFLLLKLQQSIKIPQNVNTSMYHLYFGNIVHIILFLSLVTVGKIFLNNQEERKKRIKNLWDQKILDEFELQLFWCCLRRRECSFWFVPLGGEKE